MTTLLYDTKETADLSQRILIGNKNIDVVHVRPRIIKWASPAGSIVMKIQDTSGKTIATSNSVTITSISAGTYFHGYVRFDITAHLKAETSYLVTMETTGYTFAEANHLGWIRDHEDPQVPSDYTVAFNGDTLAYSLQLYSFKRQVR